MFKHKKISESDAVADVVEVASVDGPGQPIEIHTSPLGTKRLSKKGQFLLLGGATTIISAILIGVLISGKSETRDLKNTEKASDAPGQTAAFKESPEDIKRRAIAAAAASETGQSAGAQQTGPLTTRTSTQKDGPLGARTAPSGVMPATPAQAHQLWLAKRKYERIQGFIMASDSAETADISKGGAALAVNSGVSGMQGMGPGDGDVMAALQQKMAAANGRSASARASASAEGSRAAGVPPGGRGANGNAGSSLAALASGAAGMDPAVAAQSRNKAFLKEAGDAGYLPELLKPKMGEYELTAGSVIPAVMLSGVNSDLPGTIIAQTRQTIYSTNEPDAVVIPQGSRLIGRYSADVAYGQSRVLAAWDELILPNGSRISLRGMSAADGQGQSGIEDQVNNHFWKTWSSALLVSMLGVAAQQSQPQNQGAFNTSSGSAQASAAAMNSLSEVGSQILKKGLNISPTLQVRPGMTFNVMVNRSIILPSYR